MAERWKQRPTGSTWGDWGDDDELGRVNLMTPEKVLQGVREVEAGVSFCLSLPLDYPGGTALNQRRYPPVVAPTEDMKGEAATFYNVHMSEMDDWGDPRFVDVWADDVVTLSLQYSTQWDSLAHVGAEFDADGDGVEEAVYYNGYRAGVDLVGPKEDARGDGSGHRAFAHHLGLEHMAFHGVQGRGVLIDLAHHLGDEWRGVDFEALQEIMATDGVVVEPGDMLLLHTGFATRVLEWERNPDPVKIHTLCTLPRRPGPGAARVDRRLSDLRPRRRQLCRRGNGRQGSRPEPALLPAHPPSLPLQAGRSLGRDVVPARAGRMAPRARAQPFPADRTTPAPAGHRRLTGDSRSRPSDRSRRTCLSRSRSAGSLRAGEREGVVVVGDHVGDDGEQLGSAARS